AARVPPLRGSRERARRLPRPSTLQDGGALSALAHAATGVRAVRARGVPGSRGLGGGVRVVPLLPRDDRRRDRGGVPNTPVNPAVESVSVFFPCFNDEATIASMVKIAVATIARIGAEGEVVVINDGSTDGSEQVLK